MLLQYSRLLCSLNGRVLCGLFLVTIYIISALGVYKMKSTFEPAKAFPSDSPLVKSLKSIRFVPLITLHPMRYGTHSCTRLSPSISGRYSTRTSPWISSWTIRQTYPMRNRWASLQCKTASWRNPSCSALELLQNGFATGAGRGSLRERADDALLEYVRKIRQKGGDLKMPQQCFFPEQHFRSPKWRGLSSWLPRQSTSRAFITCSFGWIRWETLRMWNTWREIRPGERLHFRPISLRAREREKGESVRIWASLWAEMGSLECAQFRDEGHLKAFSFIIMGKGMAEWANRAHFVQSLRQVLAEHPRWNATLFDGDSAVLSLILTVSGSRITTHSELAAALLLANLGWNEYGKQKNFSLGRNWDPLFFPHSLALHLWTRSRLAQQRIQLDPARSQAMIEPNVAAAAAAFGSIIAIINKVSEKGSLLITWKFLWYSKFLESFLNLWRLEEKRSSWRLKEKKKKN